MTKIDDGGPAFPMPRVLKHTGDLTDGCYGMTLRDWFAAQALAALPPPKIYVGTRETKESFRSRAIDAYLMADAMLAARK